MVEMVCEGVGNMADDSVADAALKRDAGVGRQAVSEADANILGLTAALAAARTELAKVGAARESALSWVRELEASVREREGVIAELRATLRERDRRIDEMNERLARTQNRITEVERSLERTIELQRSLEAEFDQARRVQDQTATVLAATRDVTDRSRADIAERDARIRQLEQEVARRGVAGTPAAVGTALADLFKIAKQRRADRLASSQPWRIPSSTGSKGPRRS